MISRSDSSTETGTAESLSSAIAREHNRLLFGSLPSVLPINVALALLVAGTMYQVIGPTLSQTWLALMGVVQLGRWLMLRAQRAALDGSGPARPEHWLTRFRLGALASGIAWGAGGLLLFPADDTVHQMFLAMTMAAICVGGFSSMASERVSLMLFVMPVLLPFGLRLILEGGQMQLVIATMGLMFVFYLLYSGRRLQLQLQENVQLRIRAVEREAALRDEQRLNDVIARVQLQFIREADRTQAYELLLTDLLELTDSEYGLIADVRRDEAGRPYLKSRTMSDIAWDESTRRLIDGPTGPAGPLQRLDSLFSAVLASGEAVISNHPASDPRSGGAQPPGHPPLKAFLGLPIRHAGELVAMIGLANRPGGYESEILDFLHPLLVTLGQLSEVEKVEALYRRHQVELARLSRVASQTTNGVVITDAQGRFEWINEGFTRISGYTLSELLGKRPGAVLQGPATDPAVVKRMHDALQLQQPFEAELLNYSKTGQPYWIQISCNPLRDAAGRLQGFMAIQQDITLRKADAERLRETTQLLDNIVENVPNMVFLKRASDLSYVFVNRAGERMLGLSREQLLGRSNRQLLPAELADYFDARDREALASTELVDIPQEQVDIAGSVRVVHSQKLTLRDEQGRAQYLLGIVEDITERERVERMKNEFVSTVSHELRTPLTVIAGALGLLADGVLERKPQRAREMIETAYANSQRLTSLINDLLDMEKLAAGKLRFELRSEDMGELARRAVGENQGYAEQHGAKIRLLLQDEGPLPVSVDAQRMLQVFANLLSNAAKFSPAGGVIELRLRCPSEGEVQVEVEDQGPGIPAEFRQRVFEKFAQADATNTRATGGTGLGLAITRELVQGMGGSIGFESEPGRGACFYLRFPLLAPGAPGSA